MTGSIAIRGWAACPLARQRARAAEVSHEVRERRGGIPARGRRREVRGPSREAAAHDAGSSARIERAAKPLESDEHDGARAERAHQACDTLDAVAVFRRAYRARAHRHPLREVGEADAAAQRVARV